MEEAHVIIERVLTEEEKKKFLDEFYKLNPHYRGAHVSDVLDELNDTDAHIAVIDDFFTTHEAELGDVFLTANAIRVCIYTHGLAGVNWENVSKLVTRCERWIDERV